MKKVNILVTSPVPKEGLAELMEKHHVDYPGKSYTEDELIKRIPEYDAILSLFNVNIPDVAIQNASRLKLISNYGAGYDNINIALATEKGILVTNTPDVVTEPTAEFAFGLLLSVARRISECDRRLRIDKNVKWDLMENLGTTLYGKTLGIIGMGKIGKAMSKRALTFGMNIQYHNRNRLDKTIEQEYQATYLSMEKILQTSDVLFISTPLNSETHHLISGKEFSLMKPSVILINTARGPIIDEKALVHALENKRIAGAGLDVFEFEPKISAPLLRMDNVVLAPHIGTATVETRIALARAAAGNILDYFDNKPLKYIENR